MVGQSSPPLGIILVVDDSPTILRLVTTVLVKAGYDVLTASCGEEGIEAARDKRPDLILLDYVMPGMNGYQVCRELADSEELRNVPVVLLSSKGEEPGQRLAEAMHVVGNVAKPFSPETILSVVRTALGKSAAAHPQPEDADQRDRPVESPPALPRLVSEGEIVLEGNLAAVPLAEVLVLLESQFQTGMLEVRREAARAEIFFREGTIQFATGEGLGDDFLLGRYILELGLMTRDSFDRFIAKRTSLLSDGESPPPPLMGQALIEGNHVSATDLRQALARQASERIYEVLRWRSGRFSFHAILDLGHLADNAALGLRVDALLLEGFRRLDEWHLIEHTIEDLDAVFLPLQDAASSLDVRQLGRDEAQVLALVDGHNSVKEISRQSRLSTFDVCKILYRLLSIKLIRRRVAPVAM